MNAVLEARAQKGYWVAVDINTLGFERCLLIELDKLGVDFNDLKIELNNDHSLTLQFPWAFSDEEAKIRKITIATAQLPKALNKVDFSKYDAYLQKSGMNIQNKKQMRIVIGEILKTAEAGLFVITGKPLERRENVHSGNVNQYFGDDISRQMQDIKVDFPQKSLGSYGQQMILAQVI